MTAFFELKPNKILNYTYTLYPSYLLGLKDSVSSAGERFTYAEFDAVSLFDNAPIVTRRYFEDAYGTQLSASGDFTGSAILFAVDASLSSSNNFSTSQLKFSAAVRLKDIYASSSFVKTENFTSSSLRYTLPNNNFIINIPSILYGTEIKPGSFYMENIFGISVSTVYDDGYGGIYYTDDITNSSIIPLLVGTIMYQHGILLFSDKCAVNDLIFGFLSGTKMGFSGTYKVPQNIYIIDAPKAEGNFSTNPSYVQYDTGSQQNVLTMAQPKTYITAVGLYDDEYELIGVIKLANPLYHDESTPAQIRAKLNF